MIETFETGSAKLLGVKLRGRLHDEDYKWFVPQVEMILTDKGKFRMFVEFEDFQGWDLRAAWDDLKFGAKHYADFERIAMVGDRRWQRWMTLLCKPFIKAEVRYFDHAEADAAWNWLREEQRHEAEWNCNRRAMESEQEIEAWRGFPRYGF